MESAFSHASEQLCYHRQTGPVCWTLLLMCQPNLIKRAITEEVQVYCVGIRPWLQAPLIHGWQPQAQGPFPSSNTGSTMGRCRWGSETREVSGTFRKVSGNNQPLSSCQLSSAHSPCNVGKIKMTLKRSGAPSHPPLCLACLTARLCANGSAAWEQRSLSSRTWFVPWVLFQTSLVL